MSSKYIQTYDIPKGFSEILHDYAREILRDQPDDIILYSSMYFDALSQGKSFRYASKYNTERSKQVIHRDYEYSNLDNYKKENEEIGVKSVPPVRKNFINIDQIQENNNEKSKGEQNFNTSIENQQLKIVQTELGQQQKQQQDIIKIEQKVELVNDNAKDLKEEEKKTPEKQIVQQSNDGLKKQSTEKPSKQVFQFFGAMVSKIIKI